METLNNADYTTITNNGLPQLMENHKLVSLGHNHDIELTNIEALDIIL